MAFPLPTPLCHFTGRPPPPCELNSSHQESPMSDFSQVRKNGQQSFHSSSELWILWTRKQSEQVRAIYRCPFLVSLSSIGGTGRAPSYQVCNMPPTPSKISLGWPFASMPNLVPKSLRHAIYSLSLSPERTWQWWHSNSMSTCSVQILAYEYYFLLKGIRNSGRNGWFQGWGRESPRRAWNNE